MSRWSLALTETDKKQFRARAGAKQQFELMETCRHILQNNLDNSKYEGLNYYHSDFRIDSIVWHRIIGLLRGVTYE